MKKSTRLLTVATIAALAACATPETSGSEPAVDEADDARIGAEVRNLCFTGNISGFSDYDGKTGLIVRKGPLDEYLVKLLPGCAPLSNPQRVGLDTGIGSSCLSRGDDLIVSNRFFANENEAPFDTDRCRVAAIYEWDRTANDVADE